MVYIQDARHPSQLLNSSSSYTNSNGNTEGRGGGVYSTGSVPNTITWAKQTNNEQADEDKKCKRENATVPNFNYHRTQHLR